MENHFHRNCTQQKDLRRKLRRSLTPAEATLWRMIKGGRMWQGLTWRRQFSVEQYVLDFYCPALSLAIELDGEVHNNAYAQQHDEKRTRRLEELGITVIRFENRVVFENPEQIFGYVEQRIEEMKEKLLL